MSIRLSAVLFCWLVILQVGALAGSDRRAVLTRLTSSGTGPHAWKRPAGASHWVPVKRGERLGEGDSLKTPDGSRAELTFANGITARLLGGAEVQVNSQGLPGTGLVLRRGEAFFRTDGPSLTVMTSHAAVTTRQAELVVEPTGRGTRVAVMSGSVKVQGELQELIHEIVEVASGQQTTVPAQGPPPEPQTVDLRQLSLEAELVPEVATVPSPLQTVPDLPAPLPAGPLPGVQNAPPSVPPPASPGPAPSVLPALALEPSPQPVEPPAPASVKPSPEPARSPVPPAVFPSTPPSPEPQETASPSPAPVAVSLPVEPSPEVPSAPPEPSAPPIVIPPLAEPSPEPSTAVTPSPAASPSPQVVPSPLPSPAVTPAPQRPPRPVPRDNPPLPLPANPPAPGIAPGVLARMIVVKREHRLYFFEADGRLRKVYKIGLGTRWTPTPAGVRAVGEKIPNPTGVAWALWPSSRGRAFGNRLLALFWYDPARKRFTAKSKQELHGTDVRHSVGANYSHGCMRMFNEDIEEIYQNVKVGDIIVVRD